MRPLACALLPSCLLVAACLGDSSVELARGAESDPSTVVTRVAADAPPGDVRVRSSEMTLWTSGSFVPVTRDGRREWVLSGRTSRNITSIHSWVPDDAFGRATVLSKRTFEVVLDGAHELNSILSGLPLFLTINVASGTPTTRYAAVWIEPRLDRFGGSRSLWLDRVLAPVHVGGDAPLRYRHRATVTGELGDLGLVVRAPGGVSPAVKGEADGGFTIDWTFDELAAALGADRPRTVWDGGTAQKRAGIGVAVAALGMSNVEADTAWPSAACDPTVWACMQGAGADASTCGSYRQVHRCTFEPPMCGDDGVPALTSREPSAEIAAAIEAARGQLPDGRSIGVVLGATHEACPEGTPSIAQVGDGLVRSFQWQEQWSNAGALDPAELEAMTAAYHLDALVPAARVWAGTETMQVGLVKTEYMGAPNAMTWIDFVVFYFPDADTLLAVQLVTVEL